MCIRDSVIFDAGSSVLVIDKSSYNPKKSLTTNSLNKPFDCSCINLHVYGDFYSGIISIGDIKARNVLICYGREVFDADIIGGKFRLSSTTQNSGFDVKQDPFIWAAKKNSISSNPAPSNSHIVTKHGLTQRRLVQPLRTHRPHPVSYTHLTLPTKA